MNLLVTDVFALLASLFWVPNTLEMIVGFLWIPRLKDEAIGDVTDWPRLSVIVPASNEEGNIKETAFSLLQSDYPELEIILINDRSTDSTGEILEDLKAQHQELNVNRIEELPAGWLGKNHALQFGASKASGDWILFTDADVLYEKDALRRSISVALKTKADHLVVFPEVILQNFWVKTFVPLFQIILNFRYRMWQASWKWAPGYAGIGAFNMVRRDVYEKLNVHEKLKMEVVDDIKFGKTVKKAGFHQVVANSDGLISVEWVANLQGIVQGLEKNAFAGFRYSWPNLIAGCSLQFLAVLTPFILLFATGFPFYLSVACILSMGLAAAAVKESNRVSAIYFLAWPLASLLFFYVAVRSAWIATKNNGIYWRGTFYPLEELKSGKR